MAVLRVLAGLITCGFLSFTATAAVPSSPPAVLKVTPAEGLVDQTPQVTVESASPGDRIRITARITDDDGRAWSSNADYFADSSGRLSVERAASVSGTYLGVDARGLLWSMLPVSAEQRDKERAQKVPDPLVSFPSWKNPLAPIEVTFEATALEGFSRTPRSFSRAVYRIQTVTPGVRRTTLREGRLRGILFEPEGITASTPAVVVITGSNGGVSANTGALLASHGIVALALASFNYEDLPKEQINIPLEYFRDGMEWLIRRTHHPRVALMGASTGGEGVLLIASTYPKLVSSVIAEVPVHVVYGGVGETGTYAVPAWTVDGKPVPFVPLSAAGELGDSAAARVPAETYRPLYLSAWSPQIDERYGIPVERIEAPILLLSGRADDAWPSAIASGRLVERLKARNFRHPYENIEYEGAGHWISQPSTVVFSMSDVFYHPVIHAPIPLGGYPSANSAATLDAFRRALEWISRYDATDQPVS